MKSRKNVRAAEVFKELLDEQSPKLLHELHLLTRDGLLNADARRKLKQVNHLFTLLKPALEDIFSGEDELVLLDVGAGKAYLGFILYELCLKGRERGKIISIEERDELVQRGRSIAQRLNFGRMEFVAAKVNDYSSSGEKVSMVTALHACDTATDDALILGLKQKAGYIAVVPCCQAEAARLLKEEADVRGDSSLTELWRHGIHRREFGSHLTNVLRSLVLEASGYSVAVTELVGWEHSMKNELILARKVQNENPRARKRLESLLERVPVRPKIIREIFP